MLASTIFTFVIVVTALIGAKGDNQESLQEQKNVVVVGGGIAGLAAARTLQNTGRFNVNVLEARRDKYGGRIHTDRKSLKFAKGIEVDLGAMWLNSMTKDNPLAKLASDGELTVKSAGKIQLHYPEKNQVFEGDDVNKIFTEFYKLTLDAIDEAAKSTKDDDLKTRVEESIQEGETTAEKDLLSAILASHPIMSLSRHSARQFFPQKCFGWSTTIVDGFDQITDLLVGGQARETTLSVELRKPVRQVAVDKKKNKVLVRTQDLKQFEADAVVIAVPIGVLKIDTILFDPPLPKKWKEALRQLETGYSNKVILEFNKIFWPEDIGIFTMATSNHDNIGMLQTWVNLHRFVKKPLLMGSLGGEAAVKFENMTDDEIKEKALHVLTKFFGEEKLKDVTVSIVTKSNWISDNKILSPLVYPKVGLDPNLFKTLSEPICPFIYFAGEYTTLEDMNTAHGAYMSGVRAARQIIDSYCPTKKEKESTEENKNVKDTDEDRTDKPEKSKDEL